MRSLRFREPVSKELVYTFWVLQALDVYTTNEGMKWDCVTEVNPLLPEVPHLDRILLHKFVFLTPFYQLEKEKLISNQEMWFPLVFSAYVVHNNFKVINRAERLCSRR